MNLSELIIQVIIAEKRRELENVMRAQLHNSDKRLPRRAARKLIEVYFPFGVEYFRGRAN